MMEYEVIMTGPFWNELINIINYISYNLYEPNIAERKLNNILNKISTLNISPERCPKVIDSNFNVRRFIFDNYIVIYEIVKDTRSNIYYTHISF